MSDGSRESGQATVEWIGLVAGVALVLGALLAGVGETAKGGSGLGEAVAHRITCAARDLCGGAEVRRRPRAVTPPDARPRGPRLDKAGLGALPRGGGRVVGIAEHAWIVCLGYRRWRYDLEHPLTPREALPVDEALDIVNECLNPWEFFFG